MNTSYFLMHIDLVLQILHEYQSYFFMFQILHEYQLLFDVTTSTWIPELLFDVTNSTWIPELLYTRVSYFPVVICLTVIVLFSPNFANVTMGNECIYIYVG